jgi:hypothetical protein
VGQAGLWAQEWSWILFSLRICHQVWSQRGRREMAVGLELPQSMWCGEVGREET